MTDLRMANRLLPVLALLAGLLTASADVDRAEIHYTGKFGGYFYHYSVPEGTLFSVRKTDPEKLRRQAAAGSVRIAVAPLPVKGPGLTSVRIAYQATLLAVHLSNPLRNVSSAQARALLDDHHGSWRTFGGPSARIRLYARAAPELPPPMMNTEHQPKQLQRPRTIEQPAPLGPAQKPETKPLPTIRYSRPLRVQTEDDRRSFILLCADPLGMACFDITRYDEDRIHLLSVDDIAPTLENFRSGKYPLTTIWYLTFPEKPTAAERALIRFIRSRQFAAMLYRDGMLPELPEKTTNQKPVTSNQ
ncbi:MAG: hypothetical protein IJS14_06565 [Lentisphaeria bacterium]|nr:hypothetical protein [Lentisphaeria bacterium]